MKKSLVSNWLQIVVFAILPVLVVWAPFFLRLESVWGIPLPTDGMQTIASNFDGPLYLVVAKTYYNLEQIAANFSFPLPLEYYAAHFPLYPITITILAVITRSFPWAMLLSTLLGSVLTIYYFRKIISKYVKPKDLVWITFVFAIFPARWLIVRSVGSPEPLFIGFILASVFHFNKKEYWKAGVWGALAQLTKSPGILLFVAYGLAVILPKLEELAKNHDTLKWVRSLNFKAYPVVLIPLSLLGLFYFYSIRFGDFFAYFNSGDNIHLFFPPFQIFNYSQPWVNTHWLEEIIFVYFIGALGLIRLFKMKKYTMFSFVLVFFTSMLFVSHRDVVRYSLPIVPFLYVAFSDLITSKELKYAVLLLIIPIFLFSIVFITNNVMPISDWNPLL